ncbi:MAG: hypothetical protein WC657_04250 [Candidatus Paceibacterota bacterium]
MHKATNYILVAFIITAAISYAYFANIAVRTLATLEKTKQQMQSLSVQVSDMESRRLAVENSISSVGAVRLGFVEVKNPIFIMKNSKKTTLSYKVD